MALMAVSFARRGLVRARPSRPRRVAQHAGNGGGADLEPVGEFHGRNQSLGTAETVQGLEIILNGPGRLIGHACLCDDSRGER